MGHPALFMTAALVGQLVGPGGMTPYTGGGGGGRRHGGYVTIRDAVNGFFVAGSSIHSLNGVYGPRLEDLSSIPAAIAETVAIGAYKHDHSHWILANVRRVDQPHVSEWVFFDAEGAERFAHEGNTLIPASGKSWWHLHRPSRVPPEQAAAAKESAAAAAEQRGTTPAKESTAVRARADTPDDSDELPWQVIGIRDDERLESLRRQAWEHEMRTSHAADRHRQALAPPPPSAPSREDGPPGGEEAIESPIEVLDMLEKGDASAAAEALVAAARASNDGWTYAVLLVRAARMHRRQRAFAAALAAIDTAVRRFPLYHAAHFERALAHMDAQEPEAAISALRQLHTIAPEFPVLCDWMVRAHAAHSRAQEAAQRKQREEREGRPPTPPGCEVAHIGRHELIEVSPSGVPATGEAAGERQFVKGTDGTPAAAAVEWCCLSSPEVRCPSTASKATWLGGDSFDDTFAISQEGVSLSVVRNDGGGVGWGMSLQILCCTAAAQAAIDAAKSRAPNPIDEAAAAAAAAEAERMRSDDHYLVLQVPCDFEPQELKKSYRALSLRLHPDRAGGNTEHFARAAAAHDCLVDAAGCKSRFDKGSDLDGSDQIHGQPNFYAVVERQYYPEHFPFEPFGDVFEDVRDDGAGRRNRSVARQVERTGWRSEPAPPSLKSDPAPEGEGMKVGKEEL